MRGGPPVERDWSTLRNREWQPRSPPAEDGDGGGGSSSSGARGQGRANQAGYSAVAEPPAAPAAAENVASASGGAIGSEDSPAQSRGEAQRHREQSQRWCTDEQISASRSRGQRGGERDLRRWEAVDSSPLEGTLEELSGAKSSHKGWDQFKANRELFGVVSTFKEDLSQYTTPLNVKYIPQEVKQKAKLIAQDLEKTGWDCQRDMDMGAEYEEEGDEEDLFSAVPRNYTDGDGAAGADGGIGGALLASLRAGSAAAKAEGSGRTACDHRSLIAPKVQSWWRARRSSGATVPPGCEDALVCPFSQRVFGDVSQLVTHWAAALPRAPDVKGDTTTGVATEQFRIAGDRLTFAEMVADTGLETVLTTAPRAGSVWAQIVAKLDARGKTSGDSSGNLSSRMAADVVSEAVQMRCWRRDQKVEHREVLEGIAAGLALHILEDTSGSAWSPEVQQDSRLGNDGRCGGSDNGVAAARGVVCH